MNVPPFPSPPLAPRQVSSTARKDKANLSVISPDNCSSIEYNCKSLNNNLATKRTAHQILRVAFIGRLAHLDNTVHPRHVIPKKLSSRVNHPRDITGFTSEMIDVRVENENVDDTDVVCAAGTPASFNSTEMQKTISQGMCLELNKNRELNQTVTVSHEIFNKSVGVQTHQCERLYMLKVLPTLKDLIDENTEGDEKRASRICRHFRCIGRVCFCQFGLAWLLTFWTVAGAAAFYATEGPRERAQVFELKSMQRDLAVGLATELRQFKESEEAMEPMWSNKVNSYVSKHERMILSAVNSGYGEGGDTPGGQLWTFSGCVLFTISLITTLGFGAPVPRTTSGRTVAVIFAALGIPAHFLLIFNFSLLLVMRLQNFAIRRKYGTNSDISGTSHKNLIPKWVKVMPFIWIAVYYLVGIIGFGAGRSRPLAASVLFPLDFTAAGGLATISGVVRIIYGLYLEGAVTIAAMAVAVLRVSATESFTNIGIKYGLLIEVY